MAKLNEPSTLIKSEDLPLWVPGDVTCASDGLGWKGIAHRSYSYKGQDVEIPPMDSFLIVRYRWGKTPMDRQFDGHWTRTKCNPGNFSLLSRAMESHWHWKADVEVSHLYLSDDLMCAVASDMLEKDIDEVRLHDVLRGSDPVVNRLVDEATLEAGSRNPGNAMYAEALGIQLAVHLVREYASCVVKEKPLAGQLSRTQMSQLTEYIDANLQDGISLSDLAELLNLGVWTFGRQVQRTLGCTAQALIMSHRIEKAKALLAENSLALKQIASTCGFSDQPHMTRCFRKYLGVTPGTYRKAR